MIRYITLMLFLSLSAFYVHGTEPKLPEPIKTREGISEYRLNNGLTILLAPKASAGTVHIDLVYRTGSLADPTDKSGTAHFLEHMMFKGTKQRAGEQLVSGLRKRGIHFNANTSFDRTRYSAAFESDMNSLNYLLALEAERMTSLQFSPEDMSNELEVIHQEITRAKDQPLGALGESMLARAWGEKAYGRPVLGTLDELSTITPEVLHRFYEHYYHPDNATLVLTGGFDPQQALEAISLYFSDITPSRRVKPEPSPTLPKRGNGTTKVHQGNVNVLALGYGIPAADDDNNTALAVLADIFAGEPHGRLYQTLVVPGKAQAVFALQQTFQQRGQYLFGAILTESNSHQEVQQALTEQFKALRSDPVSADELERAKTTMRFLKPRIMDDPAALSNLLSESVATGDWQLQLRRFDDIESLDLQQVRKHIEALFSSEKPVIGYLIAGSDDAQQPTRQRTREQANVSPDATRQASPAAPEKMPDVARFNARIMEIENSIKRSTLKNGMKVALRPLPGTSGVVQGRLNLRFGDLESLHNKRAVSDMAGTLLIRGTHTLSYQEVVDRANQLGAGFSMVPHGNMLTVKFESPPDSLPELLALIADVLQHPALPQQEFDLLKRQRLQALQVPPDTPASIASLEMHRQVNTYPAGDIRRYTEPQEMRAMIETVTRKDILDFHQSFYSAQHGELAISGDFDLEKTQTTLDSLFGSWVSKTPYQRAIALHQERKPVLRAVSTNTTGGYYIGRLYFPANGDSEDAAALFVAEHILGRHPIASRLGKRLREHENLTYNLRSSLRLPTTGNAARISIEGDFPAGKGKLFVDIIKEEIARLAESGISQDELDMAKRTILNQRSQYLKVNKNIQNILTGQLREDITLAFWIERNNAFTSLTVDDVNSVARRYLIAENMIEVIVGPNETK
ncbi:insulinase family protein [Marinobacter sp. 1-4A]|uniref:M16 family metallopeptidase n=1 Tax=Marinobacter sp. 1-4A TaxID=2582919 RepID=UPI0019036491|nr:pitrilysin family protein [Marinobacter sp. 1-4A]MBK1850555.1 insulinase family protein [Marinobacter sp. 1-4A]